METLTDEQAPQNLNGDATRSTTELFRYSAWVHVGAGAADCAERESGCAEPLHFHAWCRLPNQFQHQDIRERSLAAKARRMRQFRDPSTDAYDVLEGDLSELVRSADREPLIVELLGKEWWKRSLEAMKDVEEREEYQTIDRDRERMAELRLLTEDKRPADEFAELERHLATYSDAVEEEVHKSERPLRESFEAMELGELADLVREDRIVAEGSQSFMETYSKWEWFAGSFTTSAGREHAFASMELLEQAAPEVIDTLRDTFSELENSLQRGVQGN